MNPTLPEIITTILNPVFGGRVYDKATPDNLVREGGSPTGRILDFVVWHKSGGQDTEFVDQTMPTKRHARIQLTVFSPSSIAAERALTAARDALLNSGYTVGVYGSPVGTYDTARKLQGEFQQFSIWYLQ